MQLDMEELVARYGSPLYIYDLDVVRERAKALRDAIPYQPLQLLYAIKANPCPAIAKVLIEEGYGIDAVSPGEVALAMRLGLPADRILYTENNMTEAEMFTAMAQDVLINCGSLHRLERLGRSGGTEAAVRINPDIGDSEHAHTLTAGPLTKFGIHHSEIAEMHRIEHETSVKIVGCHMHIGSNILNVDAFIGAMGVLLSVAKELPNLRFINFGGGIGVPYKPEDEAIDLPALGQRIAEMMAEFNKAYGRELELRLEPGRFLVAECGKLYTSVTSVKTNPAYGDESPRTYVGCDTGFNHLLRPCLYNSYHPIENASHPLADTGTCDIVGNICETGDVFARERTLPMPRVGDMLAIGCAGAYGMSMASSYNMRPLPAELVIDDGKVQVVRRRQTLDDLMETWIWPEPEPDSDDAEATQQGDTD